MIEALRIADITRKYEPKGAYRAIVNYHCKRLHFQQIILPIEKIYKQQSSKLLLYLSEFKILKDQNQVNPVELIPVDSPQEADVFYTYWNRLRFYKLPAGMKFAQSKDPF